MFIQNKYSMCYYSIILRAKARALDDNIYVEKHHILPKSCGGNNSLNNLVKLTAREHFICHLLLPKMTIGNYHNKMVHALWRMCNSSKIGYKVSSRTYSVAREQHAEILSTVGTSGQFKIGRTTWNKGVARTVEEKQKISQARLGIPTGRTAKDFSTEWKEKISNSKKGKSAWNTGITHSDETKKLQSKIAKSRAKKECPYCAKLIDPANFLRWHGDRCRNKN
jgi:hypothetical protein